MNLEINRLDSLYNDLDYAMRERNIKDIHTLERNKNLLDDNIANLITEILLSNRYLLSDTLSNTSGIFFCFDLENRTTAASTISKYSCIFPNRTIIQSTMLFYNTRDQHFPQINMFLNNYIHFKPVIRNHIAFFSPYYVETDGAEGDNLYNKECIVHTNKETNYEEVKCLNTLNFAIPWLYNARLEDYIDLKEKYNIQFENLNLHIAQLSKAALGKQELTYQIAQEISESCLEMSIALQKKQNELKTKGIYTLLGLCMTAIPFLVGDLQQIINPAILSTLLGGSSMKELLESLKDINSIKDLNKDNPLWMLWKWKLATEKNTHKQKIF